MRVLLKVVLLALLMLVGTAPSFAHATLVGSVPADRAVLETPPETLVLRFNEPVSPLTATLIAPGETAGVPAELIPAGNELTVTFPQTLGEGTHVVSWRAVSGDGHPIAGTTVFSIGAPAQGPAPALSRAESAVAPFLWAARTMFYIGLFFGAGGAAFRILSPILPGSARLLSTALVIAGGVAAVLVIGLQGLDMLGLGLAGLGNAEAWNTGLSSVYGRTSVLALCALLSALAALWLERDVAVKMAGAGALTLMGLAVSSSGHASAADPQWLTRAALFIHMVCIAWWVGALYPLIVLLRQDRRTAAPPLIHFSRAIPFAIVPLVVSGLVLATIQLGWAGAAWLSAYGMILAVKLILLVVLFGIASWNRWGLTGPAAAGDRRALANMRRGIVGEVVLILLILGLVSGWRFTPPPRALADAPTQAIALTLKKEDVVARVDIAPAKVGPMEIALELKTQDGTVLTPKSVRVSLMPVGRDLAPVTRPADAVGEGRWEAREVLLPLAGQWTVTVELRISDFELVKLAGQVGIAP